MSQHSITPKQFIYVVDSFEEYNSEEPKSVDLIRKGKFNFKTRFFNSYKMKNFLKQEYRESNPINI
ncbi:MAG: hypothetical protein ACPHY8_05875 [Patescibacteria group bacterium]